jgi:indole-3-glycerol phosphate synthase
VSPRLDYLVEATRDRLERAMRERPLQELQELASVEAPRPFREALARPGTSLIAEHKRRSPSAGVIREGVEVSELVVAYEQGGAAAVSILTEEQHFGGSLEDLRVARRSIDLPILRKDFVIDRYQLFEAKANGADAVLLVVGSVSEGQLGDLGAEAGELDLDTLVEVHTEDELEAALELDFDVIGVNNRDLEDFSVDLSRTIELLPSVPAGKTVVAESGIGSRADVEELESVGVDGVLVGEALMRAADPRAAVEELAGDEEALGEGAAPRP